MQMNSMDRPGNIYSRIPRCPDKNQKTSRRDRQILRPARCRRTSLQGAAAPGQDGEDAGTPVPERGPGTGKEHRSLYV
jgi:hypothetical protein